MANARLARPPDSFRPDRFEIINESGTVPLAELAPGVGFDCMVGVHNDARNLTTGHIAIAPGAHLPCHTLTASESITLLSGAAVVSVEGRQYSFGPLDNITIPRGLAHSIRNTSMAAPARLHVATACRSPVRERVIMVP